MGYHFRAVHWSCSGFSDWCWKVAGAPPKPGAETLEGWRAWRKDREANYPFTYWVVEEQLRKIQNVVNWPRDVLKDIRSYVCNRFSYGLHKVETGLKKGVWQETETRILYANFSLLTEFVEVQEAQMQLGWRGAPDLTFWEKVKWRSWLPFRSRRHGIQHLDWAIGLDDEDIDESVNFSQAYSAMEIKELYLWWNDTRPARPDPWDMYPVAEPLDPEDFMGADDPEDAKIERRRCYKLITALEEEYEREDEEMLIRLIKIRRSMWT